MIYNCAPGENNIPKYILLDDDFEVIIIIIIVYFPIKYNYNLSMRFNDFTQSSEKRLIPKP